jgi:hypothetical protein
MGEEGGLQWDLVWVAVGFVTVKMMRLLVGSFVCGLFFLFFCFP